MPTRQVSQRPPSCNRSRLTDRRRRRRRRCCRWHRRWRGPDLDGFGLSVRGVSQAEATADYLASAPVALVVASPLQRAQETDPEAPSIPIRTGAAGPDPCPGNCWQNPSPPRVSWPASAGPSDPTRHEKTAPPAGGAVITDGTPRRIRTPNLLVRSQTLYPVELWAHLYSQCFLNNKWRRGRDSNPR